VFADQSDWQGFTQKSVCKCMKIQGRRLPLPGAGYRKSGNELVGQEGGYLAEK
jgi:hypothetical protein